MTDEELEKKAEDIIFLQKKSEQCYEHIGCENCRFVSAAKERIKKKLTEK